MPMTTTPWEAPWEAPWPGGGVRSGPEWYSDYSGRLGLSAKREINAADEEVTEHEHDHR